MPVCEPLLAWYDAVRRDLPWRHTRDPYRIWLSEIMLQQTRTETVKSYYNRFLALFPTVADLAHAPQEQVLKAWEGLGYYSRARNLQKAAQVIMSVHGGTFPTNYEGLLSLPGVGPYTAGAIGSIAFGLHIPAVDGNVYRVASRFYGIREDVGRPVVQCRIRNLVTADIPADRPGDYNQALMELGATLCHPGEPDCDDCPWRGLCDAAREGDAALLPVHEKKRPPRRMDVAVCLLTWKRRVLVTRRDERMLGGLYVFCLLEDETRPERAEALLREAGLPCRFCVKAGIALLKQGGTQLALTLNQRVWGWHIAYANNTVQLTLKTPPAASDDPLLPLKNARILLDAGHGGTDPGALGVGGEGAPQEKDLNLMAAQGAQQRLEQLGAEVIMLRSDDTFFSLDERLLKISEVQPDFFLSLHHNSTVLTTDCNDWFGTECYYFYPSGESFAKALTDEVCTTLDRNNRGALWNYYYVTRSSLCPAALLELGFVVSPADYESVSDNTSLWLTADAIARAVRSTLSGTANSEAQAAA